MSQFIHIDQIKVPENRQRSFHDMDKHQELIVSISETQAGLQNPIVCRKEGEEYYLVSGERRLRAMRAIYALEGTFNFAGHPVPKDHAPITELHELSPIDLIEAELEENIRRVDLTWQERALATQRLLELRQAQHAANPESHPAPTVASLTEDAGRAPVPGRNMVKTNKELAITSHLNDPDVAKAKTLDEAFKIAQRKERDAKNAQVAASLTSLKSQHKLIQGDCIEELSKIPDGTFDCILSDPPYGMGADDFGDSGGRAAGAHFYADDLASWLMLMGKFIPETSRITKPNAHMYLFCDLDNFPHLKDLCEEYGWKVFRTPLIWHKPQGNRAPWPDQGPQRKYEVILYAVKGAKKTLRLAPDLISFPTEPNLGHPAQKPVALYADLLSRSCLSGERVLDPFCGSGPIFPAAQSLKVIATGIEQDESAIGISISRINSLPNL